MAEDFGARICQAAHPIRTLRNRVAHHEPILQWNLLKHHDNIMQITEWLSPAAADWSRRHSRFTEVHRAGGSSCIDRLYK